MIKKWCHCKGCGFDWCEEDVRIESLGYKPKSEEVIKCPKCGEETS